MSIVYTLGLRTPVGRPCLAAAADYRSGMDELLWSAHWCPQPNDGRRLSVGHPTSPRPSPPQQILPRDALSIARGAFQSTGCKCRPEVRDGRVGRQGAPATGTYSNCCGHSATAASGQGERQASPPKAVQA